ncbi:MAG: hypothetical protein II085_00725 [Alphaproteobacteria bacterium]|nr:hypothetical protein [Alphaproteobacteria bacterium]
MSGFLSRVVSGIGTLAARTTGLAALGIVGYDAHVNGKLRAETYSQGRAADRLSGAIYNNSMMDRPSAVMNRVKDKIFKFYLDHNIVKPFDAAAGYFRGAAASWMTSIVPAVMGFGALLAPGKIIPRISAIGLIVYGGLRVFTEGFGIGRLNRLNRPYKE